jgi:hypothetical protein
MASTLLTDSNFSMPGAAVEAHTLLRGADFDASSSTQGPTTCKSSFNVGALEADQAPPQQPPPPPRLDASASHSLGDNSLFLLAQSGTGSDRGQGKRS